MTKTVFSISTDDKATERISDLNKEIGTLAKQLSSMEEVNGNLTAQVNALAKHYTELAKSAVKASESTSKLLIAEQRLFDEVKRNLSQEQRAIKVISQKEQAQSQLQQTQDKVTQSIQKQTFAIKQNAKVNKEQSQSIFSMTQQIFEWQIATTLVMKTLQVLDNALSSINDTLVKTEDSVISLKRVLPEGSASNSEISSQLYKIAQDYGQTFENVSQIAQNFARSGLNWIDTIKATEAAILALNVSQMDTAQASDGLIAILTQFGLKAEDLTSVVDKLNITADNAAITTETLLAALQRTGSSAASANLDLDETIALITALSQATGRSSDNIGSALKSLIEYSSKSDALDTFAGLSDSVFEVVADYRKGAKDILDVWQAVSQEIQHLDSRQADLLDSYFDTDDGIALKESLDAELEDIYSNLNGVYDTSDIFRKNYFIALLGDMDAVQKAQDTLSKANGYSQEENKKYLDSYTAKLNKLKAQWEEVANGEQGLLDIKKLLVDIGSAVLWVVQHTGGLRTLLLAISTIFWQLEGANIIAGVKSIGVAIKGLVTGLLTATSAAHGLHAALGVIGLVATAISAIVGIVKQSQQDIDDFNIEGFNRSGEELTALKDDIKKNADRFDDLAEKIKQAREVLADSSSTTDEIALAQNTLLNIQEALIRSNEDYAGSLDLTNGELSKQLDLLSQMGEEEAKKKVREYLDNNADVIYNAKQYQDVKLSSIKFSEAAGLWDGDAPLEKWLRDIGYFAEERGGLLEGLGSFFSNSKVFDTTLFTKRMTRDEQIALLEELFDKAEYEENGDYLQAQIRGAINSIKNDESYKNVQNILSGSENSWNAPIEVLEQFNDGLITYEEFLCKIGLIQEDISTQSGEWHNNISKVTGKYDGLISQLEELRDIEKESAEWEEKKLAVLEAEQALENAKNEATVRRFNQESGQWEWQADEKKIAEAEKNLENAKLDLQEAAYDNIIDQLKEQTATNDSILTILKEVAPLLGEDFSNTVQNTIRDKTGVDLAKPIVTPSESHDNGGLALGKGFINKATNRPESVNNPELTRKILSPVSNAEFNQYVRDMGIMFERSHQYAQSPRIEHIGGATDNRVNNSGQVFVEKVNVGNEQRDNLISILRLAPIMSNN